MEIPSVIAVDQMETGSEQAALDTIDSIIANNPVMKDCKLRHHPFLKEQPIESLNRTALSGQEGRFKGFTATPFSTNNSWSSRLFPPGNITTAPQGGGRGR
jgi:hypothetical protein